MNEEVGVVVAARLYAAAVTHQARLHLGRQASEGTEAGRGNRDHLERAL